ncbi:hypothetical protein BFX83_03045 [Komagataeibacter xylinus]|nr:hypothetical protein BFX83_03045 [Komagataeibacter xylinus]
MVSIGGRCVALIWWGRQGAVSNSTPVRRQGAQATGWEAMRCHMEWRGTAACPPGLRVTA